MKSTKILLHSAAAILFLSAALAQAATVTGTVTDKTTGKPAAGDPVVLVDVQAGMGEVSHATTECPGTLFAERARQRPVPHPRHPSGRRLLYRRTPGRRTRRHSRLRRGRQG